MSLFRALDALREHNYYTVSGNGILVCLLIFVRNIHANLL